MTSKKVLKFYILFITFTLIIVCFIPNYSNYSSIEDSITTMTRSINLSFNMNSAENIAESLVIVTGASANHFRELLTMIGSFQRYHSETTIFVFNLGLTKYQIYKIRMIKNVKLEHYNFYENPYFTDAPKLGGYTFKVHIINKMSNYYNVILWADTSIRLLKPLSKSLLKRLLEFPIISVANHGVPGRSIIAFAKDTTVKYLNMSREDGRGVEGFSATGILFNFANVTARFLLKKWVDCALHKECIVGVPILRSDVGGCQWKRNISDISYIGCHRYDQVAINLLAIKIYGKNLTEQIVTPEAVKTFRIERWSNRKFKKYIMWK